MATDVEKLVVQLSADIKQYEKALAKAQGTTVTQLRRIERDTASFASRIDKKLSSIGEGFKAGAYAAAVTAFAAAVRSAISDAAKIGDVADKIGLTTDKLQELQYGAVQADLSFDDLNKNLSMFSKRLGEAQSGGGELLKILEANGFDQARVKTLGLGDALNVVADLIKNAKNEQDQMLIATRAFGKSGDVMIEFLRQGSQGLQDFSRDATEAGAKIDEQLIRKAQELDDKWAAVMTSLKTRTQEATLFIVGEFQKTFDEINKSAEALANGDFLTGLLGDSNSLLRKLYNNATGTEGSVPGYSNPARRFPVRPTVSGTTVVPDADADQKAAEAARKKAEADRLAAKAAKDRLQFIKEVTEALAEEWQTSTKAAIAITDELNRQVLEQQEAVRESLTSLAELGVDAFERLAMGGEKFSDVMADVAKSIASAAIQAAIFGKGPLAGLFGTGGGGGLLGSLFGNGIGTGLTSLYHGGGTVGSGSRMTRRVSPAVFSGAPRMHNGGLAGDEVPAILQKGERVLPRGAKSGGDVTIIDQRRNAPEIEQRADSSGNLLLLIRDAVKQELPGQLNKQLPAQFGIKSMNRRR